MRVGTLLAVLSAWAVLAAAGPAPARAELPEDDNRCLDAKGHDRCADWIAQDFASFGLPAAESLSVRPGWTLRVLQSGNGVLYPALVFTDDGRGRGLVEVIAQPGRRQAPGPALSLRLTDSQLFDAKSLAGLVARLPIEPPGAPPAENPEELIVCASHGSLIFETVLDGAVSRRVRSGCFDEGAEEAAYALIERVTARLEPCRAILERLNRRRAIVALDACAGLEGDVEAAEGAWLRASDLRDFEGAHAKAPPSAFFSPDARLVTAGAIYEGRTAVAGAWRGLDWYRPLRMTGESPTVVTVVGFSERSVEQEFEDGSQLLVAVERAAFTQRWGKTKGEWRLEEMKIDPFTVYRRYDEP